MYQILWEYEVKPSAISLFEQRYGSNGDWVQLFKQALGYVGTELLRNHVISGQYITIDRWQDRAAFEAFKIKFSVEYEAMDKKFEGMTLREQKLGDFSSLE